MKPVAAGTARATALTLGLFLAAFAPGTLWSQDSPAPEVPSLSEADIFGGQAFDQAVEQSKQQEQTTKLEYLVGGVFLMDNRVGTTADTVGDAALGTFDSYAAAGNFSGKGFVKLSVPRYGAVYLGANFRHYIYQGQEGLSSPLDKAAEDSFELSEFYLSFDLNKVVFFRIGNQLIAWGPSVIWTPVDFINLEKADSQASVDLRVGKPGLRVHVPLKRSNIFLFTDFSQAVTEDPPGTVVVGELLQSTNYGLRWDLTALGFEFGLTGYLGAEIQNRFGFDLSGRLMGTDVYGEAAVALPHGSDELAYAFSTGMQRTFGDLKDWSLQGEFFYNSAGLDSSPTGPGFVPLYVGRIYAYVGLTKKDLIGTVLDGALSGFMNISDLSYSLSLKGSFDIPRVVPFSVSLGYTGGGAGKEFTYYTGDNGLSASVQVRFEF